MKCGQKFRVMKCIHQIHLLGINAISVAMKLISKIEEIGFKSEPQILFQTPPMNHHLLLSMLESLKVELLVTRQLDGVILIGNIARCLMKMAGKTID